ncbi:hypothetical protein [Candidatus Phytoplasma sp. AldY-WA1]|uniref:hypothetical protein n=1 Tax=Candidatus Phytoplasma sp. AldY-WA1 TaxID=2852100 RepID=UPI002550C35D|nr:hypothetical protein [Candidatus Phytoplasma sp. AldY-WA1]
MKKNFYFKYTFDDAKYKILKDFKNLTKDEENQIIIKLNEYSKFLFSDLKDGKKFRKLGKNELLENKNKKILLRASSCGLDNYEKLIYQLYIKKMRLIGIIINNKFIIISIFKK